jgi:hypothetical protein
MLHKLSELFGYTLDADEQIGTVDDFYFEEKTWDIRYMIVDTGSWFSGRKVLISRDALKQPFWDNESFPVNLTKEQIEKAPSIDTAKPISRQQEAELSTYYGWPMYWLAASGDASGSVVAGTGYSGVAPAVAVTPAGVAAASATMQEKTGRVQDSVATNSSDEGTKSMLRSAKEVMGYNIAANDGDIGHVENFFASDENWHIHYMMIDTRNWLPGRKVLISPKWATRVSWSEGKVHVDMTSEQIKNSPEYDPKAPIDRRYETSLHNYFGLPGYWL